MKLDARHIIAGCALAASAVASCSQDRTPTPISAEQATTATPAADAASGANGSIPSCKSFAVCSDAQALAIALVVNQGEIDEANAVLDQLRDADLRAFAQLMITDHTKLRDAIAAAAANPPRDTSSGSTGTPSPIVARSAERDQPQAPGGGAEDHRGAERASGR
jgi:hypothetical protein